MAVTWNTPVGNLGTLEERVAVSLPLDATTDTTNNIVYSVIAGSLPKGLILQNGFIKGSPGEVNKFTESRFVIRAFDGSDEKDRTFRLSVTGSDLPEWITEQGFLNVGQGESYFVLDDAKVDFQLEATDPDAIAGDTLEYYLIPNSGRLPFGLTLSKTGKISGFTQSIPSVEYSNTPTGAYDTGSYDTTPLDIAKNTSTGFDSYFYDTLNFDYAETSRVPKKLSRIYTFSVAVTDGVNAISRVFKIYVVSEEFLKADNTLIQVDTNLFQADNTNDRVPLWITDSYLGRYRANNYVNIPLEVYDPQSLSGTITYFKLDTNPDGSSSEIPPGMTLDTRTGDIAGKVPYQAAVTKNYKFTLKAVNFPRTLVDTSYTLVGDWSSTRYYEENEAVRYNGLIYICIQGHVNQLPEETSNEYWDLGVGTTDKTFNVDIIGEIESAIEWVSETDLGIIKPNQPSRISVEAKSLLYGGRIGYEIIEGSLPNGLTFLSNGLIQGKVIQFADNDQSGLTRYFDRDSSLVDSTGTITYNTIFDNTTTTFDRKFKFKIKAVDGANFAAAEKEFTITVVADTEDTFSNIFVKAFQSKSKRLAWFNFITDATIFVPDDIYRYGDENFGVQAEIKSLIYAGIESKEAVDFVQAMSRNHYNKRILLGGLKFAKAKDAITQETIYEVVYVDVVDDLENAKGESISPTIELRDDINSKVLVSQNQIRIDSDIPLASDADLQRVFPNSIKNMRNRIKDIGKRDREFLPLWMRSIQDDAAREIGFTKSMVICYAKPGRAETIIAKIQASNFDFKSIDFVADRYIIDIIGGKIQDRYIQYPQNNVSKQNDSYDKTQDISSG
jgi:hypothetical protein